MTISSRTPEGSPNRCPMCGDNVRIEPSVPPGDAPCPRCGHLLWWVRERIGNVSLDATVEEAGLDSLEVVELVMAAESEWGITVPDEDYGDLRSLRDVIRYLRRHGESEPNE